MSARKTILILRPISAARRTAALVETRGFKPFILPSGFVQSVNAVFPDRHYDAVLATSAHAFLRPLISSAGSLARLPLYCAGFRTAQAALLNGFGSIACIAKNVDELCANIHIKKKNRYIYLAGRLRRPVLEEYFYQNGAEMDSIEVYEIQPLLPTERQLSRLPHPVDFVLLYSAGSIGILTYLSGVITPLTRILCLSSRIAQLLPSGIEGKILIADEPTEKALFSLLEVMELTGQTLSQKEGSFLC